MSLPNNVQIVLMPRKTVVLDTVILIAASNFHVLHIVTGAARIIKQKFLLSEKIFCKEGLAWFPPIEGPHWEMTFATITVRIWLGNSHMSL